MMRSIVGSSITFRLLVVAVAAAALVVGASQLRSMPVEVVPDFTPTTVEVQTEALGLSAAEVEQLITVPLEQDLLNGVAFLDDIRSQSVPGLSRILMIFEPGTDLFTARQVVAERLTQAHALPNVSRPPQMLQPLSSANRVMMVSVSSKDVSALQMSVLARWTIGPRLVGVPGVANVAVWGLQDRQLQVQVDPEQLRAKDVTLLQVIETAGNALWVSPLTFIEASTPGTGGFIDTPNQRLGVMHRSPISTAADLSKVRLDDDRGRNLQLGDVATVVEDHQPLIGDAIVNDGRGLLLVIEKFPEANSLDVTRGVESAIAAMQPGMAGVDFDSTVYRPASYIDTSIDNVKLALIIGFILLALAIGAFLFRWRTALISIVVIPLSVVIAALVLYAFGMTMNPIVLLGLAAALALVVDDAVVGVEAVTRRLRQQRLSGSDDSTAAAVIKGTLESRGAMLYATLVLASAVVPLYFFERLSGAFFPDIATAYLVALLASMVVALTATPALAVVLLSRGAFEREGSPLVTWLQSGYESGLGKIVHRPRVAYVAVGAVLVAAGASVPFLGTTLLPTLKESELLIRWEGAPGTSLPEMNRITGLASRELRTIPGVREVGAHVGRAVTGDQAVSVNSAELWVSIDPGADYDATVRSIDSTVAGYPGFSRNVQTYSNGRVKDALATRGDDVVVRMYGEEMKTLGAQAAKVRQAVSGIDGISSARVVAPVQEPTLEVEVDLAKAQQYEIKPGDVRRAASTLLSGINAGSLFEEQKVFDVIVWGTPDTRTSLTSVRRLLIDTPSGGHVRLGDVADVRIAPNPVVIERQAVSRYADVIVGVGGRDRDAVVADVKERLQGMTFPLEYHAQVLSADTQPTGRLVALGLTAAIVMFLLLQAFFGSWRLATLSFLTFPIAAAGGLLAALLDGGTLSFGSYMALLTVFGLAVRSGALLMDRFRQLEQEEGIAFGVGLVLRGARERLAPVLLTGLATALLVFPVVVMGSDPGYELLHPMAIVLLGGLATATLLNLFVLPVLYLRFGFSRAAESREAEEIEAVLEDRGRTGAAGGVVVTEMRRIPEQRRD